jgi:hypothetical protein
MANAELTINDQIAAVLREINTDWRVYDHVSSENTDSLVKKKALRPDILILEPGIPAICIETEYEPAKSVELDATNRLGEVAVKTGGGIQVVIAVKLPARFRNISAIKLRSELRAAQDFEYCVITGTSPAEFDRWPTSGYIRGSLRSLFVTLQGASTPQSLIKKGADALESGASEIAAILDSKKDSHPGVMQKISSALKQEANLQTFRMSATILINAFVFQENLAGRTGGLEEVKCLEEMDDGSGMTKALVIAEWTKILSINYWPIFGIARSLLQAVPANMTADILAKMHKAASVLLTLNLGKSSDLSGIIFQRLISDRRFLATFYTTPASAALLNGLVFRGDITPNGVPWTDKEATQLRIADFACGTGSLLCAAYTEVRRQLEINGVSSSKFHATFIEEGLVGCDVMPSATHITASMLSSAFPEQRYKHTKILTLPYGRQPDGAVSLGAIEFLSKQGALSIIDTGAKGVGAVGDADVDPWTALGGSGVEDESFDLVVMNPPFTRLTGGGGKTSNVPLPMFAAFGTEQEEQELMSIRAKKLTAGTCAHGNAGEASIFIQISHNKTKKGGYIALVLPITFLSGVAWTECRELIRKFYSDITVVSIASSASGSFAFSADTDIGECLVVARKTGTPAKRINSVSLTSKPQASYEGTEIARLMREAFEKGAVATLEGGPLGGTPLDLGDVRIGEMITGSVEPIEQWPLFRIADHTVAQVAYQLVSKGMLWLPGVEKTSAIPLGMCKFQELGEVGPYHLDIDAGTMSGGAARGPFKTRDIKLGHTATYPMLAGHDADKERTLEVAYDAEGIPRIGKSVTEQEVLEHRRNKIWGSRSRLHLNTDFRFNSQSLSFALTADPSLGGRAWPTFKMNDPAHDIIVSLWWNSTLGLLSYWWVANKSQDGRGSITTTRIPTLITLDPRTLKPKCSEKAEAFYNAIKNKALLPAHNLSTDPVRAELDEFVLRELVDCGPRLPTTLEMVEVLRKKLRAEPSFNGGR